MPGEATSRSALGTPGLQKGSTLPPTRSGLDLESCSHFQLGQGSRKNSGAPEARKRQAGLLARLVLGLYSHRHVAAYTGQNE